MKTQFIRKIELLIEMYKIIFIAFFMLYQSIQVSIPTDSFIYKKITQINL